MKKFNYFCPKSLKEIWELKEKYPDSWYIAGGTDLMVKIKNREIKPSTLISLRSIRELSEIKTGDVISIGSLTTISDLINHTKLASLFPILIQAAKMIGSPQIRNVATIGGNLCNCSPCADTALPLLVLEARAVLTNSKGSREVPLDEFFLGPAKSCLNQTEILTQIHIDKSSSNFQSTFLKKRRVRMDLAIASVAVFLEMKEKTCLQARIAAGAVAPIPLRLYQVEELFQNSKITSEMIKEAQKIAVNSISPITDVRSTDVYRREIIGVFIKQAIQELLG
jgi:carbon-monoxide dehydrogenase medium subunit